MKQSHIEISKSSSRWKWAAELYFVFPSCHHIDVLLANPIFENNTNRKNEWFYLLFFMPAASVIFFALHSSYLFFNVISERSYCTSFLFFLLPLLHNREYISMYFSPWNFMIWFSVALRIQFGLFLIHARNDEDRHNRVLIESTG